MVSQEYGSFHSSRAFGTRQLNGSKDSDLQVFIRPSVNLYPKSGEVGHIRSLPELIDFNALKNSWHLFCLQTLREPSDSSLSFLEITNLNFRDAVSRCANWLQQYVREVKSPYLRSDGQVVKGQPIALLMTSDVGLLLHQFALMGLGVPVVLLSTRLNHVAIHHLLEKTSAVALIASEGFEQSAQQALSLFGPKDERTLYRPIPYGDFLFPKAPVMNMGRSVCHPHHFLGESDTTALILHSSGTTGLPKPIFLSHTHLMSYIPIAESLDKEEVAQGCNINTMPLFHGYGVLAVTLALGIGKKFCIAPTSVVADAVSTIRLIKKAGARSLMTVPSILEEISLLPPEEGADVLAKLDFVTYGGAIMKDCVGDFLASRGVRMVNQYGSAEVGCPCPIWIPGLDHHWKFFPLRSDMKMKLDEVEPVDGERRFKLTMFRFGHEEPFVMQDQLTCNPQCPDTEWTAVGRSDDLIVLSSGEKVNPHQIESLLSMDKSIRTVIAFGDNQFEVGLIVQPAEHIEPSSYDDFKSTLWPLILRINSLVDSHAKISSLDAIAVISADTIIPRTDKGSLARREAYQKFADIIAQTYLQLEDPTTDPTIEPLDPTDLETGIRKLIQDRLLLTTTTDWSDDDDLFELGMTSLQALILRRLLTASLLTKNSDLKSTLSRDFIYANSSVTSIANALKDIQGPGPVDVTEEMTRYIDLFSSVPTFGDKAVILLTGAKGSLGAHCLAALAHHEGVSHVICLNRLNTLGGPQTARTRQELSMEAKGLRLTSREWSKITVYESDLASSSLGLADDEYRRLSSSVTHILHTAWSMDFNKHLRSFEPMFRILQNLLTFALDLRKLRPQVRPRLLFTSSVATVGKYTSQHKSRVVPEIPFEDARLCSDTGYARAKFVCERILDRMASKHADELEASYVRIGQLSGSTKRGFWNTAEYFPMMVKSSQFIGALPDLKGTLSWTPVDIGADIACDLLLSAEPLSPVHHLENPMRQSWNDMIRLISASLNIRKLLPYKDWIRQVEALPVGAMENALSLNPARKLIDFFKKDFERSAGGETILATNLMQSRSKAFVELDYVAPETVAAYLDYWKSVSFIT